MNEEIKFEREHFGIYCIECIPTKKKYIGQTIESFYRRWVYHKWQLNKNCHNNTYLQNAWNKYGKENFKFYPLKIFDKSQRDDNTKDELNKLEMYYIEKYDTYNNGFNLTYGGDSNPAPNISPEVRKRIGEKNRLHLLGTKLSEETKRKMSESHKGYVKTELHRKHLSEALKGKVLSQETKEKCRIANQGSKQKTAIYTEEIIEQIRIEYMNNVSTTDLAKKYNINRGTMYGIVNNLRWKHVCPNNWNEFIANKKANRENPVPN